MTRQTSNGWTTRLALAIGAVLLGSVLLFPSSGEAAEAPADIERFCREVFGPDAFAGVDRRDNGLLCSLRVSGGLGLVHNKIDPIMVCTVQHQTQRFRREGLGVICITGQAAVAERTVDLNRHCRQAYGPDAFLTRRRTDNAPMCSVRTDGGLGLRHHVIDVRGLCGGNSARVENSTLRCAGGPAGQSAGAGPAGGDGGRAGGRTTPQAPGTPPLDPEDIVDADGTGELFDKPIKAANLIDCGGGPDRTYLNGAADPNGLNGYGWDNLGASVLCPGLTNGKIVDLLMVCQKAGHPPHNKVVLTAPSGRPICYERETVFEPDDNSWLRTWFGFTGKTLSSICSRAYLGSFEPTLSNAEKSILRGLISIVKYRVREKKVECFYMKKAEWVRVMRGDEVEISDWEM